MKDHKQTMWHGMLQFGSGRSFLAQRVLSLLGFMLSALPCSAQVSSNPEEPFREILESSVEEQFSEAEENGAALDALEELWEHERSRSIPINRAGYEELAASGLFSPEQIQAILDHRQRFGPLLSRYELQSIARFSTEELRWIIPLVNIGHAEGRSTESWPRQLFGGSRQMHMRYGQLLERQAGYQRPDTLNRYLGNPARVYLRYRYQFGTRIQYGITAEKDPGEPWFNRHQPRGFDFYSGHFIARDLGRIQELCLGDYQLNLGQGLVWWSGFGFGKSASVLSVQKAGRPLAPYTSVDESRFLRGAAVRMLLGRHPWSSYKKRNNTQTELTMFLSRKKLHANLQVPEPIEPDSLELSGEGSALPAPAFSAFIQDGLHRTETELSRKQNIREHMGGAHLQFRHTGRQHQFRVGWLASHIRYNAVLERSSAVYNRYSFSSDRLSHSSMHYSGNWRNISYFGETALSWGGTAAHLQPAQPMQQGPQAWQSNPLYSWPGDDAEPASRSSGPGPGLAAVHGVLASLHPRADMSLVHRSYSRHFQALYASPFAEQSEGRNERGLYLGISLRPIKKSTLLLYADHYYHPWLRFRADAPSRGRDYQAQFNYQATRHGAFSIRAKYEIKEENAPANISIIDELVPFRRSGLRFNVLSRLSPELRLQSRLECTWASRSALHRPYPMQELGTAGVLGVGGSTGSSGAAGSSGVVGSSAPPSPHPDPPAGAIPQRGYLIFQDLSWTPFDLPFTLTLRYALFDVNGFDARIYAFENDVLYSSSIPFFNDRGSRYYILTRIKATRWLDCYLRFARTHFSNRETLGTGLDLIEAPHRSEIKVMLRWKI